MTELIETTIELAKKNFRSIGFKEEQIAQLVFLGRKDLEQEGENLKRILSNNEMDIQALNDSLHALKGLLSNMGNKQIADKLIELKGSDNIQLKIEQIKTIFKL